MSGVIRIDRLNDTVKMIPANIAVCEVIEPNTIKIYIQGSATETFKVKSKFNKTKIADELERAYCDGVGRLVEIKEK